MSTEAQTNQFRVAGGIAFAISLLIPLIFSDLLFVFLVIGILMIMVVPTIDRRIEYRAKEPQPTEVAIGILVGALGGLFYLYLL